MSGTCEAQSVLQIIMPYMAGCIVAIGPIILGLGNRARLNVAATNTEIIKKQNNGHTEALLDIVKTVTSKPPEKSHECDR